jgi:hypothetical protein
MVPSDSTEPPASPPLTKTLTLTAPSGRCHVPLWRKNCMSGSRPTVDHPVCIPPGDEPDLHPPRRLTVRPASDSPRPHKVRSACSGHSRPQASIAITCVHAGQRIGNVVVRGRGELPTFRFSGRPTSGVPASGRSECSRRAASSLLDCLGRVRRVQAKPHAVASRALTRQPRPKDGSYRGGQGRLGRSHQRRPDCGPRCH